MNIYTYSQARQKFASVLDQAQADGKVLIRRKDGSTFAIVPEQTAQSPLDVPSVRAELSTAEMVGLIRKERSRNRSSTKRK